MELQSDLHSHLQVCIHIEIIELLSSGEKASTWRRVPSRKAFLWSPHHHAWKRLPAELWLFQSNLFSKANIRKSQEAEMNFRYPLLLFSLFVVFVLNPVGRINVDRITRPDFMLQLSVSLGWIFQFYLVLLVWLGFGTKTAWSDDVSGWLTIPCITSYICGNSTNVNLHGICNISGVQWKMMPTFIITTKLIFYNLKSVNIKDCVCVKVDSTNYMQQRIVAHSGEQKENYHFCSSSFFEPVLVHCFGFKVF